MHPVMHGLRPRSEGSECPGTSEGGRPLQQRVRQSNLGMTKHTPRESLDNGILSLSNLHHGGVDETNEGIVRLDIIPICDTQDEPGGGSVAKLDA